MFHGIAEGGIQTCMHVPRFKLMFDAGRGSAALVDVPRLLLTHGHLDHSAGIPYYISQRNLRRLPPGEIYCPPEVAEPLGEILQLWCKIEGYQSDYKITPVEYGSYYPLSGDFFFKATRTIHRVPSNAYTIVERTKKLKREFLDLPGQEIARLKKTRDDLFYEAYRAHLTFTGDTQIEFVLENQIARESRILFLECTYVDQDRPVERARKWGHIHLDEIVNNAEAFRDTEQLFLMHFSPRYSPDRVRKTLRERLPEWLHKKTTPILTNPKQRDN